MSDVQPAVDNDVNEDPDVNKIKICWNKASNMQLTNYYNQSGLLLQAITKPRCLHDCKNLKCSNEQHLSQINNYYTEMIDCLYKSAIMFIPVQECFSENSSSRNVPGWNSNVKHLHQEARIAFLDWKNANKPRHGAVYEHMRQTRHRFKYALRYCKERKDDMAAESLASSLADKDYLSFWKSIKKMNAKKIPYPQHHG